MASSREQVLTSVLSKCLALYECPHSKTDPAYEEMVKIYCDQLRPFDPWELQEGMSVLIQRRKVRKWPTVGEISEACGEVRRDRMPPDKRGQKALPSPDKPGRRELTQADRERVGWQLNVLWEWFGNGMLAHKSLADCKAEAKRRMDSRAHA